MVSQREPDLPQVLLCFGWTQANLHKMQLLKTYLINGGNIFCHTHTKHGLVLWVSISHKEGAYKTLFRRWWKSFSNKRKDLRLLSPLKTLKIVDRLFILCSRHFLYLVVGKDIGEKIEARTARRKVCVIIHVSIKL